MSTEMGCILAKIKLIYKKLILLSDITMSNPTGTISQNEIKNQGKIFKISTYNDIEIIIDTETGYVNATKLCKNINKDFRTFCKSMRYSELVELFNKENGSDQKCTYPLNFKYDIGLEYLNEVRGQYIHPNFINFVCEWCSLEYVYKVAKIMNTINDELHLRNINLQTKINEMQAEVERFEFENFNLSDRLNKSNSSFNHETPGSILISSHYSNPKRFRVRYSQLSQSQIFI